MKNSLRIPMQFFAEDPVKGNNPKPIEITAKTWYNTYIIYVRSKP